jgi:hypothetical protein
MIRFGISAFLVLILSLITQSLSAQDVRIGNGRLLKKWREDLFRGSEQKDSDSNQQKGQQPRRTNSNRKSDERADLEPDQTSRLAEKNRNVVNSAGFRQPSVDSQRLTPAQQQYRMRVEAQRRAETLRKSQSQGQPSAAAGQADYYRKRGTSAQTAGSRSPVPTRPRQITPHPVAPQSNGRQAANSQFQSNPSAGYQSQTLPDSFSEASGQTHSSKKAKRRGPPAVGFGMTLSADKSDNVYVSDIDRNGNAADAGIKKGDYILAIGGARIGSAAEFDEIAKVMSNGDQLEFKISRRGRESDLLLTFGEAPELPDEPAQQADVASQSIKPIADRLPIELPIDERYEFVPSKVDSSRRSDFESPTVNPDAFDSPTPSETQIKRSELPELELGLPEIPQNGSVLDID